jgi:hypothetical protein
MICMLCGEWYERLGDHLTFRCPLVERRLGDRTVHMTCPCRSESWGFSGSSNISGDTLHPDSFLALHYGNAATIEEHLLAMVGKD